MDGAEGERVVLRRWLLVLLGLAGFGVVRTTLGAPAPDQRFVMVRELVGRLVLDTTGFIPPVLLSSLRVLGPAQLGPPASV
jgi:hypothetical protein